MTCPGDDSSQKLPQNITRRNLAAGLAVLASSVAVPTDARAFSFWRRRRHSHGGGSCFLLGTRILTPNGEVEIEKLRDGDFVWTFPGQLCAVKRITSWKAERKLDHEWREHVAPIKISRSALAPNVPHRDLYISPKHAVYADEVLIQAQGLVNGRSIVRCSTYQADELTYFHVELEDHRVILAEGALVESLLAEGMTPLAPIWLRGGKSELVSRLRSAASPWIDRRTKADKIRDKLDERAVSWPRAA